MGHDEPSLEFKSNVRGSGNDITYCAAMTIDSRTVDQNTGTENTAACDQYVLGGPEPLNWAYITRSGHSQAPANPLFTGTFAAPNFSAVNPDVTKDLLMSPGESYRNDGPGTDPNVTRDRRLHPSPVLFTSPLANGTTNFATIAFETDLPRIEAADAQDNPPFCDRTTGANCVNPPNGAQFYPFFTAGPHNGTCAWQQGGNFIPGTTHHFGGSSTTEYGPLLKTVYPEPGFTTTRFFNNFNSGDRPNPCPHAVSPQAHGRRWSGPAMRSPARVACPGDDLTRPLVLQAQVPRPGRLGGRPVRPRRPQRQRRIRLH